MKRAHMSLPSREDSFMYLYHTKPQHLIFVSMLAYLYNFVLISRGNAVYVYNYIFISMYILKLTMTTAHARQSHTYWD